MTQQRFTQILGASCALSPGDHVLMAVSGGADSVAMLCLFASVRESFPLLLSCAHVEHGIRGEASLEDMAFVRELCREKGIPFFCTRVDAPSYARAHGCGLEDAARTLRYAFLRETARELSADVIALAHHAHDQAETVLMHAARGSDVRGLCAMAVRRDDLIRPLLGEKPQELREYLASIHQPWREDATNADMAYTRNRLRGEVLPALEAAVPGAADALCRLALAAQRDENEYAQRLDALGMRVIPLVDGAAVSREEMAGLHPALCSRQLVRLFDRAGIEPQSARVMEEIMRALVSGDAVINLTGDAHAVIGRRYLCLVRGESLQIDVPLCVPGEMFTPLGRVLVRPAEDGETGDGRREQAIPVRLLEGARVTNRREGDVIIPFGMQKPVKLKKLMIDAGIERAMRASVPVLRRGDTVLFAAGLRPHECVRSTKEEERMIVRFEGWPLAEERQSNQEEKRHD